jgi:hypothetical protein
VGGTISVNVARPAASRGDDVRLPSHCSYPLRSVPGSSLLLLSPLRSPKRPARGGRITLVRVRGRVGPIWVYSTQSFSAFARGYFHNLNPQPPGHKAAILPLHKGSYLFYKQQGVGVGDWGRGKRSPPEGINLISE